MGVTSDGYGYGDGDGYEFNNYAKSILLQFPKIQGKRLAFWKCNADASPANGGIGGTRKVGDVEKIPGPLEICTSNALHATLRPDKWKGERWFVVALSEPVVEQEFKMASLEREIIADLGKCPF